MTLTNFKVTAVEKLKIRDGGGEGASVFSENTLVTIFFISPQKQENPQCTMFLSWCANVHVLLV